MTGTNSRPVKVSVQIQPQHGTYEQMRAAWIAADELGVDTIFNWDHFYPLAGDADGLHFEAYTLLAAMAEVTERAAIGSLVTCNSYRNPNLLADMSRTIDHISGGRFVLGIGSGWAERDYFNYDYEFGTAASRLQDLKRDLPIIRKRFGKLNPGPVNGAIPILIGGGGEKVTLRLVAEHADTWHAWGDVETMAHKSQVLEDWCAKVGREPSEIERSTGINPMALDMAEQHIANGVTHFTTSASGPDYDLGPVKELLQWRDKVNATHG
jgi:probable F420-dependent oxidoreductase